MAPTCKLTSFFPPSDIFKMLWRGIRRDSSGLELSPVSKFPPQKIKCDPDARGGSVQSLSCVRVFGNSDCSIPGFPVITSSRSLFKLMSIALVMPSNHLILCLPLLFLPSIFPSIRVFSSESVRIRWPKYWSFSFSISPSNE